MKVATKKLMASVDASHDFGSERTWSNGGTTLTITDTCRCCGLTRRYFSDTQNGNNGEYEFTHLCGEELSLAQAVGCEATK